MFEVPVSRTHRPDCLAQGLDVIPTRSYGYLSPAKLIITESPMPYLVDKLLTIPRVVARLRDF